MRRSEVPPRKEPLRQGKPLARTPFVPAPRAPLPARQAPRRVSGPPKPVRRPRSPEETRTREIVRARSGGLCERCGRSGENMSHRKPVSQGGKWEPANILHVCGWGNYSGCHAWCHKDEDGVANRTGWVLKSWQDPAAEPVLFPDGRWYLLDSSGNRHEVLDLPEPPTGSGQPC